MSSRRLPFVVALLALVVIAMLAGNASARSSSRANTGAAPAIGASGVWFCPGLPASLQHGPGRVTFANLGTDAADITVTDLPDSGNAATTTFTVGAESTVTKTRDSLGPPGSLTVESFGGSVVVEEGIESATANASAPCASSTQTRQFFAAGSTTRGVHQSVVVENPYASDAKINVTLRTSAGVIQPDAYQGYDISRRSRIVIPVDTVAVRQDRVAVEVDATTGSIVATQTLQYTADAGVPGVTVALGAASPSDHWTFPANFVLAGTTTWVAITNVGGDDALVDVQAAPDKNVTVAPAAITVAQDAVTWLQVGHCGAQSGNTQSENSCLAVPERLPFVLTARAERGGSIVAQLLIRGRDKTSPVSVDAPLGIVDPARRVAYARSRVTGVTSTSLSVYNPSSVAAQVSVSLVANGRTNRPKALQSISVGPGRRANIVLPAVQKGPDAAIVVDADQPVFVARTIVTHNSVAYSAGVDLR